MKPKRMSSAESMALEALPPFLRNEKMAMLPRKRDHAMKDKDEAMCSVWQYLLVVRVLVCRGSPGLVLRRFLDRALWLNFSIDHVALTAQVRRRVVCRFPEADFDALSGWGEQVTQDLQEAPKFVI